MEEAIIIAGIEVPKADWDRTPTSIQMVVGHLERRRAEVEKRLAEVEECCKLASKNSSKPPSSDPPAGRDPAAKPKKSGKRRGGQPGHRGFGFQLDPPEHCPEMIDHKPSSI